MSDLSADFESYDDVKIKQEEKPQVEKINMAKHLERQKQIARQSQKSNISQQKNSKYLKHITGNYFKFTDMYLAPNEQIQDIYDEYVKNRFKLGLGQLEQPKNKEEMQFNVNTFYETYLKDDFLPDFPNEAFDKPQEKKVQVSKVYENVDELRSDFNKEIKADIFIYYKEFKQDRQPLDAPSGFRNQSLCGTSFMKKITQECLNSNNQHKQEKNIQNIKVDSKILGIKQQNQQTQQKQEDDFDLDDNTETQAYQYKELMKKKREKKFLKTYFQQDEEEQTNVQFQEEKINQWCDRMNQTENGKQNIGNTFERSKGNIIKFDKESQQALRGKTRKSILEHYSYYNNELLTKAWTQPKKSLNRLEIDLNDPSFFIPSISKVIKLEESQKQNILQITNQQNVNHRIEQSIVMNSDDVSKSAIYNKGDEQAVQITNKALSKQTNLVQKIEYYNQNKISIQIQHTQIAKEFLLQDFNFNDNKENLLFHRRNEQRYFRNLSSFGTQNVYMMGSMERRVDKYEKEVFFNSPLHDPHQSFNDFGNIQGKSRKGELILTEYIEEDPLILSNVGMHSQMHSHVFYENVTDHINKSYMLSNENQIINLEQEVGKFKQHIKDKLGDLGNIHFLKYNEDQNFLKGKIMDNQNIVGISTLENHLFRAPIFKQKVEKPYFLLVVNKTDKGPIYTLRRIEYLYLVGQIEPQIDVFHIKSREAIKFLKEAFKQYFKMLLKRNKSVQLSVIQKNFPQLSSQNIKDKIDEIESCQSISQGTYQITNQALHSQEFQRIEIQPDEYCRYEKMISYIHKMSKLGIKNEKFSEKIKQFMEEWMVNDFDEQGYSVLKYIYQQVQISPWELSKTFKGGTVFVLTGHGDPTNGHGGISYIKKQIKQKQILQDKQKQKIHNTDSDLRTISKDALLQILIKLGQNGDHITKLSKQQRIDLIQAEAKNMNKHSQEMQEILKKFKREERLTSQNKKDRYQCELNKYLALQIDYFSNTEPPTDTNFTTSKTLSQLIEENRQEYNKQRQQQFKIQNKATGVQQNNQDIQQIQSMGQNSEDDQFSEF